MGVFFSGLNVLVSPTGLRAWRWKYRFAGREKLGSILLKRKHARYADDVIGRLERNVFPNIGHKPVAHIEPKDIVRMMERIQGRGANDTARRVRNTCSQVFRFAITRVVASRNPSASSNLQMCCHSGLLKTTRESKKVNSRSFSGKSRRIKGRSSLDSP